MAGAPKKSVVWRVVGDVFVCVHTAEAPTDAEWEQVLTGLRAPMQSNGGILVFTEGGAPNARQRARLNELLAGRKVPVSVITPSAVARAVATAITWFNPTLHVFAPDDMDGALDHLSAKSAERPLLRHALIELRAEIGRSSMKP